MIYIIARLHRTQELLDIYMQDDLKLSCGWKKKKRKKENRILKKNEQAIWFELSQSQERSQF